MDALLFFKIFSAALLCLVLVILKAYLDCLCIARRYKQLYYQQPRICREEKMGWTFRVLNFLLTLKSSL